MVEGGDMTSCPQCTGIGEPFISVLLLEQVVLSLFFLLVLGFRSTKTETPACRAPLFFWSIAVLSKKSASKARSKRELEGCKEEMIYRMCEIG
jgi:hypothetical protein